MRNDFAPGTAHGTRPSDGETALDALSTDGTVAEIEIAINPLVLDFVDGCAIGGQDKLVRTRRSNVLSFATPSVHCVLAGTTAVTVLESKTLLAGKTVLHAGRVLQEKGSDSHN